jgi:hypothetical protein
VQELCVRGEASYIYKKATDVCPWAAVIVCQLIYDWVAKSLSVIDTM